MRPLLHAKVTECSGSADNLRCNPMAPLLENIRTAISSPRGGRPVCLVCGRGVAATDESLRLRGGAVVHAGCSKQTPARVRRAVEDLDR
jgi:hypothetical protein